MAGSYPDVPSRRMAWDDDGTLSWFIVSAALNRATANLTAISFHSDAQRIELNDEDEVEVWGHGGAADSNTLFAAIFPEPRDVYGVFWGGHRGNGTVLGDVEWSTDSQSGIPNINTWTSAGTVNEYPGTVANWYRSAITAYSWSACRAFNFLFYNGSSLDRSRMYAIHIYGVINAAYTPDRLLFIDQDTGLEFTAPLDWGDVPRGVTLDHDIKIKNNSTSYPTSDINLSFEALTGTSNTWYTIKPSGGAFSTTWSTPALAPGALSTLLTVRLTVSDNQILGPQAARIRASSVWGIAGGTSAGTGSATATLTLI